VARPAVDKPFRLMPLPTDFFDETTQSRHMHAIDTDNARRRLTPKARNTRLRNSVIELPTRINALARQGI
jgi:hypothetical protein